MQEKDFINISHMKYQNIFVDINLTVKKGNFTVVSSPNNSGKTTLMRILNREIIVDEDIEIKEKRINEYKIEDYAQLLQCIIPLEVIFEEKKLEDELYLWGKDKNHINDIVKGLKIRKILNKEFRIMSEKEIILSQIAKTLSIEPQILLVDNLSEFFDDKEIKELINYLKEYQKNNNLTIIWTTIDLKESIDSDYLYIISEGRIALEGRPLEVLEKDNIINKIGLNLPFMIDLSVKLRDYDLIEDMELNMDRMVEKLWK